MPVSRFAWIARQPTLLPGRPVSPRRLYLAMYASYGVLTGPGLVIYGLYVVRIAGVQIDKPVLIQERVRLAAWLGG